MSKTKTGLDKIKLNSIERIKSISHIYANEKKLLRFGVTISTSIYNLNVYVRGETVNYDFRANACINICLLEKSTKIIVFPIFTT